MAFTERTLEAFGVTLIVVRGEASLVLIGVRAAGATASGVPLMTFAGLPRCTKARCPAPRAC